MKHRALFIISPSLMTACVMRGWEQAGHDIGAVWWTGRDRMQIPQRPSLSGLCFPDLDTARLLRRLKIVPRHVPLLRHWPEVLDEARAIRADVLISAMAMQKLPADLIALFGGRAVNFHPSLLPHYRGPTPTSGMLIDGVADRCGGVTLHCLDADFDTGPIIAQRARPRRAARDALEWNHQLAEAAAELAARDLPPFLRGEIAAQPQDRAGGSYRKLVPGEAELGPHMTVAQITARFAAFGKTHPQRWRDPSGRLLAVTAVADGGASKGLLWMRRRVVDGVIQLRRRTPMFQLCRMTARYRALRASESRMRAI